MFGTVSKAIVTLNHCGYQMGTPSPLLQDWLSSYDGQHPLLDLGCAYGINTFKALEHGIPTACIDPEEKHLEILRQNLDPKYSHLLTCVTGELPDNIDFPDNHFSGILCADVLHFLDGEALEKSLGTIKRKLFPGGRTTITMTSDKFLKYIDKDKHARYHHDLQQGVRWPGVVTVNNNFKDKMGKLYDNDKLRTEHDILAVPKLLHFCSKEQLTEELRRKGFKVLSATLGEHEGHQDPKGIGHLSGRSLQVVAQKI